MKLTVVLRILALVYDSRFVGADGIWVVDGSRDASVVLICGGRCLGA